MIVRLCTALERGTGYAGWSVLGAVSGLLLLGLAMVGLYWDVAWHVDFGRDKQVFTPPHILILVALSGLMCVALLTISAATATKADVRLRVGRWRVPWSALLLFVFRAGGLVAFVLDDLWHQAYGVDVTLLSPPHLGLIGSGSLSAVSLWLMLLEGRTRSPVTAAGRGLHVLTLASMLVAFSTYQLEFDYGVPLFSLLLLPVFLLAAAALALVPARLALGPGGALWVVAAYLVLRGSVALLIGAMGHTVPRLALYLPAALAVELAARWAGTGRPLRFALASAALLATAGLAGEWVWQSTVGHHHVAGATWPLVAALGAAAAAGGAVLGAAVAGRRLPVAATAVAGAALVLALGISTQRDVGAVDAVVSLDRLQGEAVVTLELRPPSAARDADLFQVLSVQGDGRIRAALREVRPGLYQAESGVPVGEEWKTLVALYRGTEVMAVPVRLPADPQIGASEVPAVASREMAFGPVGAVLLREAHAGPRSTAIVVYAALGAVFALWIGLLARVVSLLRPGRPDERSVSAPPSAVRSRRRRRLAAQGSTTGYDRPTERQENGSPTFPSPSRRPRSARPR